MPEPVGSISHLSHHGGCIGDIVPDYQPGTKYIHAQMCSLPCKLGVKLTGNRASLSCAWTIITTSSSRNPDTTEAEHTTCCRFPLPSSRVQSAYGLTSTFWMDWYALHLQDSGAEINERNSTQRYVTLCTLWSAEISQCAVSINTPEPRRWALPSLRSKETGV